MDPRARYFSVAFLLTMSATSALFVLGAEVGASEVSEIVVAARKREENLSDVRGRSSHSRWRT